MIMWFLYNSTTGEEGHTLRFQIVQEADQVPQRAAQPVEFPNYECIIFCEYLETLCQFRSFDVRPCGLIGEDALTPHLLEGGKLQVKVLVFGRNPRIADIHEPVLSLIFGTTKLF